MQPWPTLGSWCSCGYHAAKHENCPICATLMRMGWASCHAESDRGLGAEGWPSSVPAYSQTV